MVKTVSSSRILGWGMSEKIMSLSTLIFLKFSLNKGWVNQLNFLSLSLTFKTFATVKVMHIISLLKHQTGHNFNKLN